MLSNDRTAFVTFIVLPSSPLARLGFVILPLGILLMLATARRNCPGRALDRRLLGDPSDCSRCVVRRGGETYRRFPSSTQSVPASGVSPRVAITPKQSSSRFQQGSWALSLASRLARDPRGRFVASRGAVT